MLYLTRPTFDGADPYATPRLAVFASGKVRRAVNTDVVFATAAGIPSFDLDSSEQQAYLEDIAGL